MSETANINFALSTHDAPSGADDAARYRSGLLDALGYVLAHPAGAHAARQFLRSFLAGIDGAARDADGLRAQLGVHARVQTTTEALTVASLQALALAQHAAREHLTNAGASVGECGVAHDVGA